MVFTFDGEVIRFAAAEGYSAEVVNAVRQSYPMRPGHSSTAPRAVLTRAVSYIPDVKADREFGLQNLADMAGFRSSLSVPMLCDREPIGAKIPRTRRWRVTAYGRQVMGTSLYLRYHHFPNTYSKIATLIFFLDCEQVTEKESMRDKQQPSRIKLMFSRESMMIRNDLKTQMDSPIFDTRRGLPLTPLAAALITLVGTLRWLQTNHRCRRLAAR